MPLIEIVKGLGANNVLCETFCAKRFVRSFQEVGAQGWVWWGGWVGRVNGGLVGWGSWGGWAGE